MWENIDLLFFNFKSFIFMKCTNPKNSDEHVYNIAWHWSSAITVTNICIFLSKTLAMDVFQPEYFPIKTFDMFLSELPYQSFSLRMKIQMLLINRLSKVYICYLKRSEDWFQGRLKKDWLKLSLPKAFVCNWFLFWITCATFRLVYLFTNPSSKLLLPAHTDEKLNFEILHIIFLKFQKLLF